jgi:hypothetical protein
MFTSRSLPVLFVAAAVAIRITSAVALADGHVPIVRRAVEQVAGLDKMENSLLHNRPDTKASSDRIIALSVYAKAALQATNTDMHMHLSAEDRERLGISPDAVLPRRDALLQQRATIVRQRHFANSSAMEVISPLSLLQEAEVKHHARHDSTSRNAEKPTSPDRMILPDWVPPEALAEDGTLNLDLIRAPPHAARKQSKYLKDAFLEETASAAYQSEMTRLGRENEIEETLAIMEDQEAAGPLEGQDVVKEELSPDPWAFRFYKFTPVKLKDIKQADRVHLAEFRAWIYDYSVQMKKVAVAWNEQGLNPENHEADKAIDDMIDTSWEDKHMGDLTIVFSTPIVLTNYALVTGSASWTEDPLQWYFEGSNDLKSWKMLHGQLSDANVPSHRKTATDLFSWKIDCHVSDWQEWSECNANCSGGNQTRIRKVLRHSWNNGKCDYQFSQLGMCNEHPCEVGMNVKSGVGRGAILSGMTYALAIGVMFILYGQEISE